MNDETKTDTAQLEARIEQLERRLTNRQRLAESRSGAEEAFWALMHRIFPDEAREHLRKAGREQLLAARVYIDKWIARLDAAEESTGDAKRETIEIS